MKSKWPGLLRCPRCGGRTSRGQRTPLIHNNKSVRWCYDECSWIELEEYTVSPHDRIAMLYAEALRLKSGNSEFLISIKQENAQLRVSLETSCTIINGLSQRAKALQPPPSSP